MTDFAFALRKVGLSPVFVGEKTKHTMSLDRVLPLVSSLEEPQSYDLVLNSPVTTMSKCCGACLMDHSSSMSRTEYSGSRIFEER